MKFESITMCSFVISICICYFTMSLYASRIDQILDKRIDVIISNKSNNMLEGIDNFHVALTKMLNWCDAFNRKTISTFKSDACSPTKICIVKRIHDQNPCGSLLYNYYKPGVQRLYRDFSIKVLSGLYIFLRLHQFETAASVLCRTYSRAEFYYRSSDRSESNSFKRKIVICGKYPSDKFILQGKC